MKSVLKLVTVSISLLLASTAMATGVHDHNPRHGGIVVESKNFDAELVAGASSLQLYIRDHGKVMSVKGVTAKVTVLVGTTKSEFELKPTPDFSRLEATPGVAMGKGSKAIAVVTLAGKQSATVRFQVK